MMCQFPIDLNCIFNLLTNPLKFSVSFMFERSTHICQYMTFHPPPPPFSPTNPFINSDKQQPMVKMKKDNRPLYKNLMF